MRTHVFLSIVLGTFAAVLSSIASLDTAHAAPALAPCTPQEVGWVGFPYLNHFRGNDDTGNCAVFIQTLQIMPGVGPHNPIVVDLGGLQWIQEARIDIQSGGTLQGGPGSSILVTADTQIFASNGGVVNLVGSSAEPIVLSSNTRWGGISFYSGATGTLDHVQILRAGSGGGVPGGFGDERAAVFAGALSNFPVLSIKNSLIKDSFGDGYRQALGPTPATIQDTQFINNAGYAVNFVQGGPTDQSGQLQRLTATGNGACILFGCLPPAGPNDPSRNMIRFEPLNIGNWSLQPPSSPLAATRSTGSALVSASTALPYPGLPFFFDGSSSLGNAGGSTDHRLELSPGFQVRFLNGGITVFGGNVLSAMGTAAQPIVFTSALPSPSPGDWDGFQINAPAVASFDHVLISYTGRGGTGGNSPKTAVGISSSTVSITNSVIDRSAGAGLLIPSIVNILALPTINGVQFTNNGSFAIDFYNFPPDTFDNNKLLNISASNNGTCNLPQCVAPAGANDPSRNAIRIPGIGGVTTWGPAPLTYPGIPLFIDGTFTIAGTARLGPGFQVHVLGGIVVASGATLDLSGTAVAPLILRSARPTPAPGDWGGVWYQGGNQGPSQGAWNFVKLRHAGGPYFSTPASLYSTGSNLTITNSLIELSAGDDVRSASPVTPVIHSTILGPVPNGSFGVNNFGWQDGQPLVDATGNDWGSPSGPSGAGPGTGVPVSTGVDFGQFGAQAPTLAGAVTLQGRTKGTNAYVVPLQVKFYTPNTSNLAYPAFNVMTDAQGQGTFSVTGFSAGTYDVEVKMANSTALKALGVTFPNSGTIGLNFGTLRSGDANGDGRVDTADFSALRASFGRGTGTLGFNPLADFNGDGVVDVVDFALLRTSFGSGGGPAEGVPTLAPPAFTSSAPR